MHGRGNRASGQILAGSGVRGVDSAWSQHPQGEPAQGTPQPGGHASKEVGGVGERPHISQPESCLAASLDTRRGRAAGDRDNQEDEFANGDFSELATCRQRCKHLMCIIWFHFPEI